MKNNHKLKYTHYCLSVGIFIHFLVCSMKIVLKKNDFRYLALLWFTPPFSYGCSPKTVKAFPTANVKSSFVNLHSDQSFGFVYHQRPFVQIHVISLFFV